MVGILAKVKGVEDKGLHAVLHEIEVVVKDIDDHVWPEGAKVEQAIALTVLDPDSQEQALSGIVDFTVAVVVQAVVAAEIQEHRRFARLVSEPIEVIVQAVIVKDDIAADGQPYRIVQPVAVVIDIRPEVDLLIGQRKVRAELQGQRTVRESPEYIVVQRIVQYCA